MKVEIDHFDYNLWSQFCVYCQRDGKDVKETMEAWVKRANRQAEAGGSIMPMPKADGKDKVVSMRTRRKGTSR